MGVAGRDPAGVVSEAPEVLIAGERVALGPVRTELVGTYARWLNTPGVRFGLGEIGILSELSEAEWVEKQLRDGSQQEPSAASFTIYDRTDMAPVGLVSLFKVSHRHRRAALGIHLGERRGQGLGTEAVRLTLDWGFHVLGLNNVLLEALTTNTQAIRAYERAGFRAVGVRRQGAVSRGELVDELYMDAVRADFGPSVLEG